MNIFITLQKLIILIATLISFVINLILSTKKHFFTIHNDYAELRSYCF